MNHRYISSFLTFCLLAFCTVAAASKNVTVTLSPGSSGYTSLYNKATAKWEKVQDLSEGANTVSIPTGASIQFYPSDGHTLVSLRYGDGNREVYEDMNKYSYIQGYAELTYMNESAIPAAFYMDTKPNDQLLTYTATINIDEVLPSISCVFYDSNEAIPLKAGKNTISYHPELITRVYLRNNSFQNFAEVKLNGIVQQPNFVHTLLLSPNAVIDIATKYGEEEYEYELVYHDETGFWTDITVVDTYENETPVTVTDNKFKAKKGNRVNLYCRNADKWYVSNITDPNGVVYQGGYTGKDYLEVDPAYPFTFTADQSGTIEMTGHVLKNYNVTFHVEGAEHVNIYHGDKDITGELFDNLKEGDNHFEVFELESRIMIRRAGPDSYLQPVTFRAKAGAAVTPVSYFPTNDEYVAVQGVIGEGAEFFIKASDAPALNNVTVNVNSPESIKIYTAYNPDENIKEELKADLAAGSNQVGVPENISTLYVLPANEDATITAVHFSNDGNTDTEVKADPATGAYIVTPVGAGTTITIVAETKTYSNHCTIYVDNANAVSGGVKLDGAEGRSLTLNSGYNNVGFNTDGEEVTIHISDPEADFTMFVNGVRAASTRDEAGVSAKATLHPADVVKVYVANPDPQPLPVSFTINGRAQVENVITDIDTRPADISNGLMVLPGTRVRFEVKLPEPTASTSYTATVKSNGTELTPSSEGVYTIYADAATEVTITTQLQQNSIDTIETVNTVSDATYYDMTGRRVARPAAGLYIRVSSDGTASKVIVK